MRFIKYLFLSLVLFCAAEEAAETVPLVPNMTTSNHTLSIEADFVNYVGTNKYTHASGNVIVVHGNTMLRAESVTLNPDNKEIHVTNSFIFNRGQQQIYGTSLTYDYRDNKAEGRDIGISIHNNQIKGQHVTIWDDKIEILDAYQTTCTNLQNPCNHITSKRMTIYPEWGNVVNDHAVVYVFFLPVMYVPNSVSDLNGTQDSAYSAIPQIGRNPVEGYYAKAGWSFYQNEKFNGTWDLHYLSLLGARLGLTNNYKLDQANRGQIRLHYLTGLGGRISYGLRHQTLLGVPQRNRGQIIDDFFSGILPPSKDDYPEATLELTSREMVGYQWRSYQPKIGLSSPAYEIPYTGVYYSLSGYGANIIEESVDTPELRYLDFVNETQEYLQYNWEGNLERHFDLGSYGSIRPWVLYSNSSYNDGAQLSGYWRRWVYNIEYKKSWQVLDFTTGYKYTPEEEGFSPFNSETFYAGTSEENNFGIGWRVLDNFKLNYSQIYSITERAKRDETYGAEFLYCHWKIFVNYSTYFQQFSFGGRLE